MDAASATLLTHQSMHRLLRTIATAILLLSFVGVSFPARGSIVQALDLEDLVDQSDGILLGCVVLSESFVLPNGMLGTSHRIEVERDLQGRVSGEDEVVVETLGGRIGRIGMRVEGEPSFVTGERVIVFVCEGKGYAAFRPVGMGQGVMRVRTVDGVETVSQTREGMLLMRRGAKGDLERSPGALPNREPLDAFLSRLHTILERKADGNRE